MVEEKSKKITILEKDEKILWKYIESVTENNKLCNQRYHRFLYLFLITSILLYFLCFFEANNVNLFGISVPIPKDYLLILSPVILSYIYYCFMSFASLSGIYSQELMITWKKLTDRYQKKDFTEFHFYLLSSPHLIFWSQLKATTEKALFFKIVDILLTGVHFIGIIVIPPLVIFYFILKGWSGDLWPLIPYGMSIFFIVYSIYEFVSPIKIPS